MFKKIRLGLSAALLTVGIGGAAQASLIGATVSCFAASLAGGCDQPTALVGPGVEFVAYGSINVDVDAEQVTFTSTATAGQTELSLADQLTLFDLAWTGIPSGFVSGLTLGTVSGVTNIEQGDLNFTDTSISINMAGVIFDPLGSFVVNIATRHEELPEPATIALFGLGLAGLGLAARRRKAE